MDRVLSDEEFDAAIVAADCIVLAYGNSGPSGVLGKAALAGTPVLAAGSKSLRREARRSAGSIRWVKLTPSRIGRAMDALSDGPIHTAARKAADTSFVDKLLQLR
jgi:hypothetical protein